MYISGLIRCINMDSNVMDAAMFMLWFCNSCDMFRLSYIVCGELADWWFSEYLYGGKYDIG